MVISGANRHDSMLLEPILDSMPAIKVGGRGQWRVETAELEQYIQRMYAETRDLVTARADEPADPEG